MKSMSFLISTGSLPSSSESVREEDVLAHSSRGAHTWPFHAYPQAVGQMHRKSPNKVNLCGFITTTMANLGRENMAFGKKLIIGGRSLKDGERMVCTTNTTCEDLEELRSNHKEADTRLLLHAKYATHFSICIVACKFNRI